jgi:5-formyltetrahydrofolate cyclo-ligase
MTDKQAIRKRVWDRLESEGYARFPFPPHGRITNFEGAKEAAERALDLPELARTDAVKANPDAPQLPLRRGLLKQGTTVYMAVPRLRETDCFVELDPERLNDLDAAPTVSHMQEHGRQVGPGAVPELDAIVLGSVAVTKDGARIGKGEGYSDLEYAILRELGLVDDDTATITTVHDAQVIDDEIAVGEYDVPLDVVCTPTRAIRTDAGEKPEGLFWDELSEDRIGEIPVLDELR